MRRLAAARTIPLSRWTLASSGTIDGAHAPKNTCVLGSSAAARISGSPASSTTQVFSLLQLRVELAWCNVVVALHCPRAPLRGLTLPERAAPDPTHAPVRRATTHADGSYTFTFTDLTTAVQVPECKCTNSYYDVNTGAGKARSL
ncbi:hypothetical protein FB451DRAFT_1390423 [Mycena latifolia]|nr:hypothetical protein FB451DRAFT_1390423 [Mycena latifolia]